MRSLIAGRSTRAGLLATALFWSNASADVVVRSGTGAAPNDLLSVLQQFQTDLGGTDNGVAGGPFTSGFRILDWDGIPDSLASPNLLPQDYYQTLSPRGIHFDSLPGQFQVSADSANPTTTPILFGDIDPSYPAGFQAYSAERVFAPVATPSLEATFYVPSDPRAPAWVSGLGIVFASVDSPTSTSLEFLDRSGDSLGTYFVPAGPAGGLSFLGVSFTGGEEVWSFLIYSGNAPLGPGILDGGLVDLVVMDDFVFGEPQVVPEPSVWGLCLGGLLVLALRRGRRQPQEPHCPKTSL
jgi:hypothetical protein